MPITFFLIVFLVCRCGAGFGIALWIFECYVVLINSADMHNVRGCTISPPYIDEFDEPDPGLR